MDVLIFQPTLCNRGGAERVILNMARKYGAPIYTCKYEPGRTYEGFAGEDIRIIGGSALERIPSSIARLDPDARMAETVESGLRFLALDLKNDYDAISAHLPPGPWIRNHNPRVSWYCHGTSISLGSWDSLLEGRSIPQKLLFRAASQIYKAIEVPILRDRVETIAACSGYVSEKVFRHLGRGDAEAIPPGFDAEGFRPESYGKFFLLVSRIVPEKNIGFAIDAFKRFSRSRPGWSLRIACNLHPNPRNAKYFSMLKAASAGHAVKFEMDLPDSEIKYLYSHCYATLNPARDEGWGITVLEAMASSKPSIAYDEGGHRATILDGQTGFLVSTPQDMAGRMEYLADRPEENERMGRMAAKRAKSRFTWAEFDKKMDALLRKTSKM